jgi:hypothetical protein
MRNLSGFCIFAACLVAGLMLLANGNGREQAGVGAGMPSATPGGPNSAPALAAGPLRMRRANRRVSEDQAPQGLADLPPELLLAIENLEGNPDPESREQAVIVLEESPAPVAAALLEFALRDPDPTVREAAIGALLSRSDAAPLELLIHHYFAETAELREEIVHGVAEVGGAGAAEFLLLASNDESPAVRAAARAYQ